MKKVILSSMLALAFAGAGAVTIDTIPSLKYTDPHVYLTKSQKQKTGAFLLCGAGLTSLSISFALVMKDISDWGMSGWIPGEPAQRDNTTAIDVLAAIGLLALAGSAPLFIAAARNKRKYKLYMKKDPVGFSPDFRTNQQHYSFGIKN